jgi:hypothetical protein
VKWVEILDTITRGTHRRNLAYLCHRCPRLRLLASRLAARQPCRLGIAGSAGRIAIVLLIAAGCAHCSRLGHIFLSTIGGVTASNVQRWDSGRYDRRVGNREVPRSQLHRGAVGGFGAGRGSVGVGVLQTLLLWVHGRAVDRSRKKVNAVLH